jgi:Ca2+-binding RTX toxin-like protein
VLALAVFPAAAQAAPTTNMVGGALTISSNGTSEVTVNCDGHSPPHVIINNAETNIACNTVTSLTVNGGGEGNWLNLVLISATEFTNMPASTPIVMNGGGGSDMLDGSGHADQMNGGSDSNTDYLTGNGGNDTLIVSGNGADDLIGVSGTDKLEASLYQFVNIGNGTIETNGPTHTFSGIDSIEVNAPPVENFTNAQNSPVPVTVDGGNSNDIFILGPFNDTFNAGAAPIGDQLLINSDSAAITLGNGAVTGAGGSDSFTGVESATITSLGGTVSNVWNASGFTAPVTMFGGPGNDNLTGAGFNDALNGEAGNDTLVGNNGQDTLDGGVGGTDTANQTGVTGLTTGPTSVAYGNFGTDQLPEIELLFVSGNGNPNVMDASTFSGRAFLNGFGGADTLTGTAQDDTLSGGDGLDNLAGGAGNDQIAEVLPAPGTATVTDTKLTGVGGDETLTGFEVANLFGTAGNDTLDASGFSGNTQLSGSGGNDTLLGGSAINFLNGGIGVDSFIGGPGTDLMEAVDATADAEISCGAGIDTVNADPSDPTGFDCDFVNGNGDMDGDGISMPADNCPAVVNPDQANSDGADDGGDACDADDDNDGIADADDACPTAPCPEPGPGTGDPGTGDPGSGDPGADDPGTGTGTDRPADPGATADTVAPALTAFSVTPAKFAAAGSGASVAAKRKAGAKVAYKLSEASTVTFTVARKVSGRKAGKRCVKKTRKNRGAKQCTRLVKVNGSFSGPGNAGDNRFRFTGRLNGKKLRVGKYVLIGSPVDASGNKGKRVRARFRIVRRR